MIFDPPEYITEELRQLREQNAMLDAEAAKDEALLRQALEALENSRSLEPVDINWVKGKREATIAALRERLK